MLPANSLIGRHRLALKENKMSSTYPALSRFSYTLFIRTTTDRLWQALMDPNFTRQYWCDTWIDSAWMQGASWKLMIPDGRVGDAGTILEIIPAKRLVLSWQNEFKPELKAEGPSTLTCLLEPVGTSVKFTVTHEMNRPNSRLIASVSTGWPMLLSSLKSLLETGESLEETRKWPEGM